jgi:hypothetical protein
VHALMLRSICVTLLLGSQRDQPATAHCAHVHCSCRVNLVPAPVIGTAATKLDVIAEGAALSCLLRCHVVLLGPD